MAASRTRTTRSVCSRSSVCAPSTTSASARWRRAYDRAKKAEGKTGEALVIELERRLDALVLRSGIARTIYQARQMVVHGHIEVNGRKVDKPSFRVRPDDVVMVRERSREKTSSRSPARVASPPTARPRATSR